MDWFVKLIDEIPDDLRDEMCWSVCFGTIKLKKGRFAATEFIPNL